MRDGWVTSQRLAVELSGTWTGYECLTLGTRGLATIRQRSMSKGSARGQDLKIMLVED